MDRLARDPIHQAIVVEECMRTGAPVLCVIRPLDNSDSGKLIQYVEGYAAKMEREKIRERNMRGKHAQLRKGRVQTWGFAPYGYRINKHEGVRVVEEEEAAIVRYIFRWVGDEGVSLSETARRLNAQGTPSPGTGKYPRRGEDWSPNWNVSQVSRLIHRPDYMGVTFALTTEAGKDALKGRRVPRDRAGWIQLPEGATPPLVSPELWEKAQTGVLSLRTEKTRNQCRQYLLRGRIFCALCGRPMRSTPDHGRFTYRCSSRETLDGPCGGKPVPASDAIPKGAQPRDARRLCVKADEESRRLLATIAGVDAWAWQEVLNVAALWWSGRLPTRQLIDASISRAVGASSERRRGEQ